jgi:MipA family protein
MTINTPHLLRQLAITFGLITFSSGIAAQQPEWQLGAGAGVIDFRLYPGSRDNKTYLLPLPYFTYLSKYLEVDRGLRGLFPFDSNWYLDVSADFGLPVKSDDSAARLGMPNLDAVIQIGPSLEYTIDGKRSSTREFRFELPLRSAIALDIEQQTNEGWIAEPRLVYEQRRSGRTGLNAKARAGLRYATQSYHAYYYDVNTSDVTPQRSLYQADQGYSGLVVDISAAWRHDNVLIWGILRYENLNHGVIDDSPLVEDKHYYFIGLGVTWILASSP